MLIPTAAATGLRRGTWWVVGAALLVAVVHAAPARADYAKRFGVMLGGGAYKLSGGGYDHSRMGPWAQTGLRFSWTRKIDVEATYRNGFNWDDKQVFRTRTTGFDLGLLYSGRPDRGWTWQVFGGSGVFWWNVQDFRSFPSATDSTKTITPPSGLFDGAPTANGFREDGNAARLQDSNFKVFAGLGVETHLISNMTLRLGVRLDYLILQHVDNTGASDTTRLRRASDIAQKRAHVDANDLVPAAFGAITYWFGSRDRDEDGIDDKLDACPDEPEDKDGFQDEDGCPDLDNDNDGVADATDKCVNEAEDKDGFEDEDGCPDPDNDKDTVLDAVDRCPTDAEDIDQFEDSDGCPDPDNDKDGVLDGADKCPDTPPGVTVDGSGCPLAKTEQERQLIETGVIVLRGVKFDTGKAVVKPEFAARLDSVAAVLVSYPTLRIEIAGHTDSRGSDASNLKLSQRRAQAVADYLKTKQIDTAKYSVTGYGEGKPIASNDTEDGMTANRRVEFAVLNREELDAEIQRRRSAPAPAPSETPAPAPASPPQPAQTQPPATPPQAQPPETPQQTPPAEPTPAPEPQPAPPDTTKPKPRAG